MLAAYQGCRAVALGNGIRAECLRDAPELNLAGPGRFKVCKALKWSRVVLNTIEFTSTSALKDEEHY
jgi:hypothetical protein